MVRIPYTHVFADEAFILNADPGICHKHGAGVYADMIPDADLTPLPGFEENVPPKTAMLSN
jgi:hypothetical protein